MKTIPYFLQAVEWSRAFTDVREIAKENNDMAAALEIEEKIKSIIQIINQSRQVGPSS